MFFTSYEFIGFFIILFLLYYFIPKRFQWMLLLVASYVFYCAANPKFLLYLVAVTVSTFFIARIIGGNITRQKVYLKENKTVLGREEKKEYKNDQIKIRKRWLIGGLIVAVGILSSGKFSMFFPLGISFYTFMALSYLIDVYRENIPAENNFFRYMLFVSFFPQLIQGPISRYDDMAQSLYGEHSFDGEAVYKGFLRILWGYFKKLVIADRISIAVKILTGQPDTYSGAYALVTLLLYTIELYADFTGGIDITIGIAQTLGITIKENFILPYFSKSLKEYWRRWHISMCNWFKDYVFYPVSTSKVMHVISKTARAHFSDRVGKRLPVYLSSVTVWLLTGIWHGVSWNFVVWGLLNCLVLMVSEELQPCYRWFHQQFPIGQSLVYRLFQVGRTFTLICFLNLFDCFESAGVPFLLVASIFTKPNWGIFMDGSLLSLGLTVTDYLILLVGIFIMLIVSLMQRRGLVCEKIIRMPYPAQVMIWMCLILLIILWGVYGIGYDSSQFIYNQF